MSESKLSLTKPSIAVATTFILFLALASTAVFAATVEVSLPTQLTTDTHYDRNPSAFKAIDGTYWLFFARGQTTPAIRPAYDPDSDSYDIYFITSSDNGATWSAETKLAACSVGKRGMDAFQDNSGKIWVFVSGPGPNNKIEYCTSIDNGATWNGPTDTGLTGIHVDALQLNNDYSSNGWIYLVYESGGIKDAWSSNNGVTWVEETIDAIGGLPKAMDVDNKLQVVYVNSGDLYYKFYDRATSSWSTRQTLQSRPSLSANDPVIYKKGTTYGIFWAPWDSGTNSQWIESLTSSDSGTTWSSSKHVTNGGYGTTYWWDMWPDALVDGSNLYLFYGSEKGTGIIDGNIFMYKVDWNLANDHFEAIQTSINAAVSGDTIKVAAGTYNEAINVDRSLILIGQSGAIIKPDNTTPLLDQGVRRAAIYIAADVNNVTVTGFEIDGTDGDVHYGIYAFNSQNAIIKNNLIHDIKNQIADPVSDVAGVGILFFGWGQGVNGSIIQNNTVYKCGRMSIFIGGMQSETPYDWMLSTNNTIKNNIVNATWQGPTSDHGGAIQINTGSNSTISGNTINNTGSSQAGIYITVSPSNYLIISGNTISNGGYGILLKNGVNSTISGNTISGSSLDGIQLFGTDDALTGNNVSQNNVYNNGRHGIILWGNVNSNNVTNNIVYGNTYAGIALWSPSGPVPSNNLLYFNFITKGSAGSSYTAGDWGVGNKWNASVSSGSGNFWSDLASNTGYLLNPIRYILPQGSAGAIDYHPLIPSIVYVDPAYSSGSAGGHTFGYDAFNKIQDGIIAVASEGIVYVNPGNYTEQLEITKNVTIKGSGIGITNILSPVSLPLSFTTSAANYPIVYIHDVANATLSSLTIDGQGVGNSNYRFIGVGFRYAGGTITKSEIKGIRETPLNGDQHGVAIYAYNDIGSNRIIYVTNNQIYDYQKNGMALSGAKTFAIVLNNNVNGAGNTTLIAQNGIQIGYGAGGTIQNNIVSGNWYTGNNPASTCDKTTLENLYNTCDWASGILAVGSNHIFVSGNTLSSNQVSTYTDSTNTTFIKNKITGGQFGIAVDGTSNTLTLNKIKNNADGIFVTGNSNLITKNEIDNNVGSTGVHLTLSSNNNQVYSNNFNGNIPQAVDDGANNQWYSGTKGNWWSDWRYNAGYTTANGFKYFIYKSDGTTYAATDNYASGPLVASASVSSRTGTVINLNGLHQSDFKTVSMSVMGTFLDGNKKLSGTVTMLVSGKTNSGKYVIATLSFRPTIINSFNGDLIDVKATSGTLRISAYGLPAGVGGTFNLNNIQLHADSSTHTLTLVGDAAVGGNKLSLSMSSTTFRFSQLTLPPFISEVPI